MELNVLPEKITFSIPFSDNSGNKIEVNFLKGRKDILLHQGNDRILIDYEDLDKFREMIEDAIELVMQEREEIASKEKQ